MIKFDNPAYPEWLAKRGNEPAPLKPDWLLSLFWIDARGDGRVIQFDGPPMAYYEINLPDGGVNRFQYQTVKWKSADLDKLRMRVKAWA